MRIGSGSSVISATEYKVLSITEQKNLVLYVDLEFDALMARVTVSIVINTYCHS